MILGTQTNIHTSYSNGRCPCSSLMVPSSAWTVSIPWWVRAVGHRDRQVPARAGTKGAWDMEGEEQGAQQWVLLIPRSGGACGGVAQALE